jgi:hypothetical protein
MEVLLIGGPMDGKRIPYSDILELQPILETTKPKKVSFDFENVFDNIYTIERYYLEYFKVRHQTFPMYLHESLKRKSCSDIEIFNLLLSGYHIQT